MKGKKQKKWMGLIIVIALLTGLAGCGAEDVSQDSLSETKKEVEEKEEAETAKESYTIRISTIPADNVVAFIEYAAESFREIYPDFQAEIITIPYDDYVPQAPRVLGSEDNAFDMCWIQREQHWKTMANDGMFMVINDLYEENNWEEALGEATANLYKNDAGDYVGVCDDIAWVGNTFYNKAIFEELNLSVPKSFDELTQMCDVIKEAGYIPIASNGSRHTFYIFAERFLTEEEYDALCDPERAKDVWESDSMIDMLETFKDFSDQYFQEGAEPAGVFQAAGELFAGGGAAMLIGIDSMAGIVDSVASEDFEYGYFCFPDTDRTARVLTYPGNSLEILSSTDQPELCKEFLTHMMSLETQNAVAENGWLWPSRMDLSESVLEAQSEIRQKQVEDMNTRGTVGICEIRFASSYIGTFDETIADFLVGNIDAKTAAQTIGEAVKGEG